MGCTFNYALNWLCQDSAIDFEEHILAFITLVDPESVVPISVRIIHILLAVKRGISEGPEAEPLPDVQWWG